MSDAKVNSLAVVSNGGPGHLAAPPAAGILAVDSMSPEALGRHLVAIKARVQVVHTLMRDMMKEGVHYGTIPGTPKPGLWQPGAELLLMTFQLRPRFEEGQFDLGGGHREYTAKCVMYGPDGAFLGERSGSCSTMESKYRWRTASRACPECHRETIIKGKEQFGGGWVCYRNKGGCGFKFKDDDERITSQKLDRVENPDLADVWHTCRVMAQKRAEVGCVKMITGASEVFTIDADNLLPSLTDPDVVTVEMIRRARHVAKIEPKDWWDVWQAKGLEPDPVKMTPSGRRELLQWIADRAAAVVTPPDPAEDPTGRDITASINAERLRAAKRGDKHGHDEPQELPPACASCTGPADGWTTDGHPLCKDCAGGATLTGGAP